ncbi:hypothetical protein B0H14DRAFT_3496741 [Mycena olivaceomarginata]|nr:hypothetical protein B0H14DRAFT_3496741 [Mycena olivaceomarginata]
MDTNRWNSLVPLPRRPPRHSTHTVTHPASSRPSSASPSCAPWPPSPFRPRQASRARPDLLVLHRPLRPSRTSTLHSQVHAHSARSSSSRDKNGDAESMQAQLAALRAQVARLELAVAQLAAPDREDALYAYVEDALAPLEKGVRRVERRVGRLRAGRKELEGASPSHSGSVAGASGSKSKSKTIFVPAQPTFPHTTAFALVSSGFDGSPAQPSPPTHTTYVPPPLSPTNGSGAGKRRALDSIPEEEGVDVPLHVLPHPRHTHPAYTPAHAHARAAADVDVGVGGTLLSLLRPWLAACVALAVYPLYVVLKPVRAVGRLVREGVGLGRGRAPTPSYLVLSLSSPAVPAPLPYPESRLESLHETIRILPYSPCALRQRLPFVYRLSFRVPFAFIVLPSFSGPDFISHRIAHIALSVVKLESTWVLEDVPEILSALETLIEIHTFLKVCHSNTTRELTKSFQGGPLASHSMGVQEHIDPSIPAYIV